jgi:hypothetical protein
VQPGTKMVVLCNSSLAGAIAHAYHPVFNEQCMGSSKQWQTTHAAAVQTAAVHIQCHKSSSPACLPICLPVFLPVCLIWIQHILPAML